MAGIGAMAYGGAFVAGRGGAGGWVFVKHIAVVAV